jgi:predicted amidohydrolase
VSVVYANLSGQENGLEYTGLSAIIGPDGLDLARAGKGPAVIITDIKPEQITEPG